MGLSLCLGPSIIAIWSWLGGGRKSRRKGEGEEGRIHFNLSLAPVTCSVGTVSPHCHQTLRFPFVLRGTAPPPQSSGFPPGSAWSLELAPHAGAGRPEYRTIKAEAAAEGSAHSHTEDTTDMALPAPEAQPPGGSQLRFLLFLLLLLLLLSWPSPGDALALPEQRRSHPESRLDAHELRDRFQDLLSRLHANQSREDSNSEPNPGTTVRILTPEGEWHLGTRLSNILPEPNPRSSPRGSAQPVPGPERDRWHPERPGRLHSAQVGGGHGGSPGWLEPGGEEPAGTGSGI